MNEASKKERNVTFDIIKGIAIYLMVLGHCGSPCHKVIYLFHMAVFFIVAGYFFKEKYYETFSSVKDFIKKRIVSLYVPFVVLNVTATIFHNFFIDINIMTDNLNFSSTYSGITYLPTEAYTLCQLVYKIAFTFLFSHAEQIGGATWFLRVLFFVSVGSCIGYYLRNKIIKKSPVADIMTFSLYCGCLILGFLCSKYDFNWYSIGTMLSCSILFYLGILYKKFEAKIPINLISLILSLGILYVIWLTIPYSIGINANRYVNPLYLLIASTAGFIFVKSVAEYFSKLNLASKIIAYMGAHSISILLLHFLSFKIITLVQIHIYNQPKYMLAAFPVLYTDGFWWILYSLAGTVVPLFLSFIYNNMKDSIYEKYK